MNTTKMTAGLAAAVPMWVQTVEDVWISARALGGCIRKGPVLCIASGGCTPLGLVRAGAENLVAVDINPRQLDVLRLKLGGLRSLATPAFVEMLLPRDRARRLDLYRRVRESVPGLGLGSALDGWMARARQSMIPTPGQNKKRYLAGALNARTGKVVYWPSTAWLPVMTNWFSPVTAAAARIRCSRSSMFIAGALCGA